MFEASQRRDAPVTAAADATGDARSLDAPRILDLIEALGRTCPASIRDDSARIDTIAALERLKSAAAAAQARLTLAFAESQHARHAHQDGAGDRQTARSIHTEIALARRESPHRGRTHVGLAAALREMPVTAAALSQGEITEWQAILCVRETAVLSVTDRQAVDRALAGRLAALGDRGVADEARRLADRIDPAAALRRCKRAVAARRVSIRPAPGGMSSVTGSLPVAHGVAAYAALRKHAVGLRTQGDPRSVGQIMADEFFSRLTGDIGSSTGSGTRSPDVEVGLVMSERSLLRGGTDPAVLTGPDGDCFGHVPAMLARRLVRAADRVWLRRLYAAPTSGELVAMDSRRRTFSGTLRALLVWRDRTCRMPWCEAPVRHVDHVLARSRGGPTRSDNGEGLCEACNYVKEEPGWRADVVDLAGVVFTTPSGHRYPSRPPPAPGHDRVDGEERLRRSRDDWIDGLGA